MRAARFYKGYGLRGYKFETEQIEHIRATQNSGITVVDEYRKYYFGVLEEVIAISYVSLNDPFYIFQCRWYDYRNTNGIKTDQYELTLINTTKTSFEYDKFIFPEMATQVYYSRDLKFESWSVVCRWKPRDVYALPTLHVIEESSDNDSDDEELLRGLDHVVLHTDDLPLESNDMLVRQDIEQLVVTYKDFYKITTGDSANEPNKAKRIRQCTNREPLFDAPIGDAADLHRPLQSRSKMHAAHLIMYAILNSHITQAIFHRDRAAFNQHLVANVLEEEVTPRNSSLKKEEVERNKANRASTQRPRAHGTFGGRTIVNTNYHLKQKNPEQYNPVIGWIGTHRGKDQASISYMNQVLEKAAGIEVGLESPLTVIIPILDSISGGHHGGYKWGIGSGCHRRYTTTSVIHDYAVTQTQREVTSQIEMKMKDLESAFDAERRTRGSHRNNS